jgi:phospholipid transport system substrate-binding protein
MMLAERQWLSLFAPLLFLAAIEAAAAPDAKSQLRETVDQVLEIIVDEERTGKAKRTAVRDAGQQRFALKQMAALVLGKAWKGLKSDERDAFVQVFTDTLLDSYMRKIETYSGETVEYGEATEAGKRAIVSTTLKGADKSIPVNYKLFVSGEEWLVYDVDIDGVSIVKTYRQQYSEYLEDKSVDDLMRTMREKLAAD